MRLLGYLGWFFLWVQVSWASDILPANQVFVPRVSAVTQDRIDIDIDIKPKYYLYRQRLFSVGSDDLAIVQKTLSPGMVKTDPFFGEQSVWYGAKNPAKLSLKYRNINRRATATIKLKYQGCEEKVICYPPETTFLTVHLPVPQSAPSTIWGGGKTPAPQVSRMKTPATTRPLFSSQRANALLSEDDAFGFVVTPIDKNTWALDWQIADGYYLYRNKIKIVGKGVRNSQLSPGLHHRDAFFGEQPIYRGSNARAMIYFAKNSARKQFAIQFQGCSDRGVCYPVMSRHVALDEDGIQSVTTIDNQDFPSDKKDKKPQKAPKSGLSEGSKAAIDGFARTLGKHIYLGIGLLFLAGLALSWTPCVLPMLPILLGIITKQKRLTRLRSAVLSSSYALGVAVMMAVFGVVVAKTGVNLQIIFQKPLWLVIFAVLFFILGLAMLGVFNVATPSRLQHKIHAWQNRFNDAHPGHLFIVGALSTLVVGPCIAPPLIAVLTFISTTNNSLLGALYLFALGVGMGTPLVIFATLSTQIPKTGALSKLVTKIFALLMFGVGLWLLARLIPGALAMVLWGGFMVAVAGVLWRSRFINRYAKRLSQALAVAFLALGLLWLTGGLMGNSNPFKPLTKKVELPFVYVDNYQQLKALVRHSRQPVMLDLYADWCVSCQELEHIVFVDPDVIKAFEGIKLVKLDITDTTAAHRKMLATLNLVGPPALLFFKRGKEIISQRQIGVISAQDLVEKLAQIKAPLSPSATP